MTVTLTREQVREIDRIAIEEYGIPGIVLMENAGRGAAEWLMTSGVLGPVVICAGKGNNGGDGFVIARHLVNCHQEVRILLFAKVNEITGDAAINLRIVEKMQIPLHIISGDDIERVAEIVASADWIVDALLGTGTRGKLREPFPRIIEQINQSGKKVFAVDLPSGLDCDTGQSHSSCVKATQTATFVALKQGFTEPGTKEITGEVCVIGIGIPDELIERVKQ